MERIQYILQAVVLSISGLGCGRRLGRLEIFIAADIITSAVSPSWEKVGILVAIVGVRTVLSYFLRMEVRQGMR